MDRKTRGFTANHLTVMFVALMVAIAPSSLWAVANFQRVVIQDPQSGKKAAIDGQRRLRVYDERAAADELPDKFVSFFVGTMDSCDHFYTVPANKALIIQSMSAYLVKTSSAADYTQALLYRSVSCASPLLAAAISTQSADSKVVTFGSGIPIPAGTAISANGVNNSGTAHIYGYLVPASWVPQSAATVVSEGAARSVAPGTTRSRR